LGAVITDYQASGRMSRVKAGVEDAAAACAVRIGDLRGLYSSYDISNLSILGLILSPGHPAMIGPSSIGMIPTIDS
jgi:hypothetical protein